MRKFFKDATIVNDSKPLNPRVAEYNIIVMRISTWAAVNESFNEFRLTTITYTIMEANTRKLIPSFRKNDHLRAPIKIYASNK